MFMNKKLSFYIGSYFFPGFMLFSSFASADVTGKFNTTGLTKIIVQEVGNSPPIEMTVDIADGAYHFNPDKSFSAGDIPGSWRQKGRKYIVSPTKDVLVGRYVLSLQQRGVAVQNAKLKKVAFGGTEYDNGIFGNESYVYSIVIPSGDGGTRQLKVSMEVYVAANLPQTNAASATARSTKRKTHSGVNTPRHQEELAAQAVADWLEAHPHH
jgi:hypothetical protein